MAGDDLHAEMNRVLSALLVTSEVPAARIDTDRVHQGKPGAVPPAGPRVSAYEHHRKAYQHAIRTGRRPVLAAVVEAAQAELRAITHAQRRADASTKAGKLEIALSEGTAKEVARDYNTTPGHVYRCRAWARQHGHTIDDLKRAG